MNQAIQAAVKQQIQALASPRPPVVTLEQVQEMARADKLSRLYGAYGNSSRRIANSMQGRIVFNMDAIRSAQC